MTIKQNVTKGKWAKKERSNGQRNDVPLCVTDTLFFEDLE